MTKEVACPPPGLARVGCTRARSHRQACASGEEQTTDCLPRPRFTLLSSYSGLGDGLLGADMQMPQLQRSPAHPLLRPRGRLSRRLKPMRRIWTRSSTCSNGRRAAIHAALSEPARPRELCHCCIVLVVLLVPLTAWASHTAPVCGDVSLSLNLAVCTAQIMQLQASLEAELEQRKVRR
jgi:hypothetical protein